MITTAPEIAKNEYRTAKKNLADMYNNSTGTCRAYMEQILSMNHFSMEVELSRAEMKTWYNACNQEEKKQLRTIFNYSQEENAFAGHYYPDALKNVSKLLFEDTNMLQILDKQTPEDKPELRNRALEVHRTCKVVTGPTKDGGTYIAIYKK